METIYYTTSPAWTKSSSPTSHCIKPTTQTTNSYATIASRPPSPYKISLSAKMSTHYHKASSGSSNCSPPTTSWSSKTNARRSSTNRSWPSGRKTSLAVPRGRKNLGWNTYCRGNSRLVSNWMRKSWSWWWRPGGHYKGRRTHNRREVRKVVRKELKKERRKRRMRRSRWKRRRGLSRKQRLIRW